MSTAVCSRCGAAASRSAAQERGLGEGLAAGERDAAAGLLVEDAVAQDLLHHRVHRRLAAGQLARAGRARLDAGAAGGAAGRSRAAGAPCGQTVAQAPQEMQRVSKTSTSGANDWLSGLWHHRQRAGQPLRKTVVRMPGPSCSEKRCTLKIRPRTSAPLKASPWPEPASPRSSTAR